MNTENILYALLGLILLLSYGVLYLSYKISRQNKIINKPQENYGDSLEIIESAQKQANAIVEKAVDSAKHILFETEYVKQDITREMQDSLSKVAEETVKMVQGRSVESDKEFRAVVEEIKKDFAKEAAEKLSAIEKITKDETQDFKDMLRRETIGSQEIIGQKISNDFIGIQKELEEYKKIRLSEIDSSIDAVIKDVTKKVISESLTLPIQKEIILKALEKAKKTTMLESLIDTKPSSEIQDYSTNPKP